MDATIKIIMTLEIQFLWYEDCPSHEEGLRLLQDVLAELDVEADIQRVKVETEEQAQRLQFPGSPTIRVNGEDIDPDGAASLPSALTCRAYRREDGRISPLPSRDQVRTTIQRAI
ncbi:MAG: hypothetical protein MAG451_01372 [Anaerolineales bacterium]|nr:hypothetical protein [Anaerolineales bacterium]